MKEVCVPKDGVQLTGVILIEQLLGGIEALLTLVEKGPKQRPWRKCMRVGNTHESFKHGPQVCGNLALN